LLALTLAGQFALTMFEGTFALYAKAKFDYGPVEVGYIFVVCGLVMTVFQAGASLGVQNAANSLGQAGGPLLGGLLFIWQINAPYLFSGAVLLSLALVIGWKAIGTRRDTVLQDLSGKA
jgi:hypothetical protein